MSDVQESECGAFAGHVRMMLEDGGVPPAHAAVAIRAMLGMLCFAPGSPERLAAEVARSSELRCRLPGCWCTHVLANPDAVPMPTRRLIAMSSRLTFDRMHSSHFVKCVCPEGDGNPCVRTGILTVVLLLIATHPLTLEALTALAERFPIESVLPPGALVN